ncbi:isoprenylcysteine carboxylmethyltransferase family protein [Bacillus sp. SL00103]
MPNAMIVKKGPYRWLKHPNYVVVAIELLLIPLLFDAYVTLYFVYYFKCMDDGCTNSNRGESIKSVFAKLILKNHYQLCYTFINDKHSSIMKDGR